jgi:hypothetical protein
LDICVKWFPLTEEVVEAEAADAALPPGATVAMLELFVYSVNNLLELAEDMGLELEGKLPSTRKVLNCAGSAQI